MKPKTLALTAIAAFGGSMFLANPAEGQGLEERINYVLNKRAKQQANNNTKARMLSVLLYTDINVEFTDTPARDAINYLKTILGIDIVGRWNDDRNAVEGLDPEAAINLTAENQNALTVLEMVISQAEDLDSATWQLRDGYVEIGPKTRLAAKSAQELRYYPIRDLLFEPPMFDNAPSLDLDSALNQGNNSGGGGGFGGGGGGGGGFGGGGGGSGGGGGGSLFDDPDDDPDRVPEAEKAQELIDLIVEIVEPDAWIINGGDWASVRYYSGVLIVRAPDFVQRQLGGYPFATRPNPNARVVGGDRRYVTFTGGLSHVSNAGFKTSPSFGGAAGGGAGDPSRSSNSTNDSDSQSNSDSDSNSQTNSNSSSNSKKSSQNSSSISSSGG